MLSKEKIHLICGGLRLRLPQKHIAKMARCNLSTVSVMSRIGPTRVLLWGDSHCGSNVGLTPPAYQTKFTPNPQTEEHRTLNKWASLQKECWDWYINRLNMLKPIDKLFYLGDGIDGTGHRCGGTDLIIVDRKVQVQMAIEAIEATEAKDMVMVYGTPYHTGQAEDFEMDIALHFKCKIGGHEWEDVNGCTFDLKHKQGNCDNPTTGLWQQIKDHREWAGLGEQPRADVLVRAHTHRFCILKMEDCIGITIPGLMAYGTKFGARQCSKKIQFGLVALDVWPDGVIVEHIHIAKLAGHITHKN
ncbi:hypothetical protein LCGC14_0923010 [marine sediment metagenome]|uniref:Calcineurin-like phosphoesterase domain-containing protein n=1 Tax=marine sediment metagenome TaxID=412755 RepID=A0A0F9RWR7_9ZZZZ